MICFWVQDFSFDPNCQIVNHITMIQIQQSDLSPLGDQFHMVWQHIEEMI